MQFWCFKVMIIFAERQYNYRILIFTCIQFCLLKNLKSLNLNPHCNWGIFVLFSFFFFKYLLAERSEEDLK